MKNNIKIENSLISKPLNFILIGLIWTASSVTRNQELLLPEQQPPPNKNHRSYYNNECVDQILGTKEEQVIIIRAKTKNWNWN